MSEGLEEAARAYLDGIARPHEWAIVERGPAGSCIADVADERDAGLVVVASSGKGLARRIALGSTTNYLMHSLHRPLLIVRE